ncbi:DUF885 domain-containing protein [Aliifodinibius sp. S!AR15-10]|uniref:DUF885 family protein n=1 Tax=Aliifodinibius sp. S!AR15-10 TaxID=2950437 RepID=UPI00285A5C0D|nr:DUF885 family protein [Aliifodinibius sp. S!AR15-10]MDR8392956.1 DUF885 domain-containing protein [Aliifodinibius sp. S!AR15-10]
MMKQISAAILLLLFTFPQLHAQSTTGNRVASMVEQYEADTESMDDAYLLKESPEYFERMEKLYNDWLTRLEEVNYEELDVQEAVDYILLRRNIQRELQEVQQDRATYGDIEYAIEFADTVFEFLEKRRVGQDLEGKAFADQMNGLVESIQNNWSEVEQKGRLEPAESRRAVEVAENLHETLDHIYSFYDGYDPDVTWWGEKPYQNVDTTLANYISFLEDWRVDQSHRDEGSGIIGTPVGADKLQELLEYEMIPYTPSELIKLANKEYAWCMKEMLQASRELGYGDDWHEALEHVKNSYVPVGKQPEMIYDLAVGAIDFLEERDLLTVPELAKETWDMEMMTPERQLINPFFLGGRVIRISYPTNTMAHEDKMMSMRGNNPHFSKATVHHELIAGHHLQGFMTDRYNTHRSAFRTPFWIEGWALYWELQLYGMGFPESPEDRIGMLFWRMHRCARIIFSLSYHLGGMSPQEAIDFLVEKVGHEYANAEAEVRRSFASTYPPLYQAAYLLGGLQIRSLYNELVENGDMPVKEFHDRILKNGNMPVEMVKKILTGEKPPKDFETNWRFYPGL